MRSMVLPLYRTIPTRTPARHSLSKMQCPDIWYAMLSVESGRARGDSRLLDFMRHDKTGGGGGGGGKDRGQMVRGDGGGGGGEKHAEAGPEDRPGACANHVAGPLDKTVEGVAALALATTNKWRRSLKTDRVHARSRHT